MIVGRHPRPSAVGDTVLSRNDFRRGDGVAVDPDGARHRVYWRDGTGTVPSHMRRELTVSCLGYRRR